MGAPICYFQTISPSPPNLITIYTGVSDKVTCARCFQSVQTSEERNSERGKTAGREGREEPVQGADLGGGCRGCAPPASEMTCGFVIQLVFCQKKKLCGLLVLK